MAKGLGNPGRDLIKHFEDLRLKPYRCSAGVLTIGYGHTGPDVTEGLEISREEAERLLTKDVAWAVAAVNKALKVPTTQSQFDAMVSLVFNIGERAFRNSTLLLRHNEGRFFSACNEFLKWQIAAGKKLRGLKRRRCAEAHLYTADPWQGCTEA